MPDIDLQVGLKTDPIEYRFSYEWLFRLLAQEGVRHVQLGTFFELFHLPDEYFVQLRRKAEDFGVEISSVFSAHRELGGFFRDDPRWESVARRSYERLIEVGALLGAESVGANSGSVLRDRMGTKTVGIKRFLRHMKELMGYAHQHGVPCLTIEPMSCLAEPPALPDEIRDMAEELVAYHAGNAEQTSSIGYCADVSHGYVDRERLIQVDNLELLTATLPYVRELHLKNTDEYFQETFGFSPQEREKGVVQIDAIRDLILNHDGQIPVKTLVGYLEIEGPKLGRDYSDPELEWDLRESLRYLKETFETPVDSESIPDSKSEVET